MKIPAQPEVRMGDVPTQIVPRGPGWLCFHCGERFLSSSDAHDHFGCDETESVACVQPLTETQKALIEDRRMWRARALLAEERLDHAEYLLHGHRCDYEFSRYFKKARSVQDCDQIHESMEGRALASESALRAAPRWLASYLRRRAERLRL